MYYLSYAGMKLKQARWCVLQMEVNRHWFHQNYCWTECSCVLNLKVWL